MDVCADAGDLFLEKHPESEVAEACILIIEKIIGGNKANLSEDRSTSFMESGIRGRAAIPS
jgi:hypothetical protein